MALVLLFSLLANIFATTCVYREKRRSQKNGNVRVREGERESEGLDSLALGLLANSVLTLGWPEQNRVFANADISFTIFTRSHMLLLLQGLHVIFSQDGCQ